MKDNFPSLENKKKTDFIAALKKGTTTSISILNGIVGDYLDNKNNALSVQMQFYKNEKPLNIDAKDLALTQKLTSKICIFIHGLTNDETIWNFPNEPTINYGTLLQNDLNFTPFYVRYNTGLHISENGKQFSQLIDTLTKNYPKKIDEIVIIAHSMGGLVTRSACHYAPLQNANWHLKISNLFFLGTPHLGASLEKFGNGLTFLLKTIPVSYTQLIGDIINLRSAGIKDLRYGYLTDDDWKNNHPDELLKNNKTIIPLLEHTNYFLISGTITNQPKDLVNEWFGDILVTKNSATGQSNCKHNLAFDLKNHKEFAGISHIKLVDNKSVYLQIKDWLTESKPKNNTTQNNAKQNFVIDENNLPSKKEINETKINGVLKLTTTAFLEGVNKLVWLNKKNSKITYSILNQIPVVNIFSKEIESVQNSIQDEINNIVIKIQK